MLAGIVQALCFVSLAPAKMQRLFWHDAVCWPFKSASWRPFFTFFAVFTALHAVVLTGYLFSGVGTWDAGALPLLLVRKKLLIIGFVGTLALAWAEELLFRGLFFQHFRRFLPLLPSAILSSFIFSLLHDLRNPLRLLTTQWQLGLGLFLLGMLLTYIRVWWGSMAASAGAHAGLVYLKVILRKISLLPIAATSPFLFPVDLRQSLIVHILMILGCYVLHKTLLKQQKPAQP